LRMFRMGNRVSFIPALNLGQISEFSLVICSLGVGFHHINENVLSIVVYTLAITSVVSTYAIVSNHTIFLKVNPLLKRLGLRDLEDDHPAGHKHPSKAIVFLGFSRYASSLLHELIEKKPEIKHEVAVVDFNPQVKPELDRRGIFNIYGDI